MKAACKQCGHPRKRPGTCDPCRQRAKYALKIEAYAMASPRRLPHALQMAWGVAEPAFTVLCVDEAVASIRSHEDEKILGEIMTALVARRSHGVRRLG